jgi:hypothetical protein
VARAQPIEKRERERESRRGTRTRLSTGCGLTRTKVNASAARLIRSTAPSQSSGSTRPDVLDTFTLSLSLSLSLSYSNDHFHSNSLIAPVQFTCQLDTIITRFVVRLSCALRLDSVAILFSLTIITYGSNNLDPFSHELIIAFHTFIADLALPDQIIASADVKAGSPAMAKQPAPDELIIITELLNVNTLPFLN